MTTSNIPDKYADKLVRTVMWTKLDGVEEAVCQAVEEAYNEGYEDGIKRAEGGEEWQSSR